MPHCPPGSSVCIAMVSIGHHRHVSSGGGFGVLVRCASPHFRHGPCTNTVMSETEHGPADAFPNEACRTCYLGHLLNLSECLVESPDQCPFVMRHGQEFFCQHPDCRRFEKPVQNPKGSSVDQT
jgi:hypothetical protein